VAVPAEPEVRIHLSPAPQRRVLKPSVPQRLSPSRSERKLEARLLDHSTVVAIQGGWVQLVHLGNIAAYVVARIFLAQPLGHASGEFQFR